MESLTETPAARAVRLAPRDDEPVTVAEESAIAEAESNSRPPVPLEELLAEFRVKKVLVSEVARADVRRVI